MLLAAAFFFEFLFKALALLVTVEAAHTVSASYLDALKEATRTYLTLVDIQYSHNRGL
jgi:hypothetical protein